jgi:hypothetical protein
MANELKYLQLLLHSKIAAHQEATTPNTLRVIKIIGTKFFKNPKNEMISTR